jgi:hypothetical protein
VAPSQPTHGEAVPAFEPALRPVAQVPPGEPVAAEPALQPLVQRPPDVGAAPSEPIATPEPPARRAAPVAPRAAEPAAPPQAPSRAETTAEFLASSPVLKAQARPVHRATRPARHANSPVAVTLAALASEVDHLGVPEGQRAGARALLLDLARRVEEHRLGWEDVRHAMSVVMDCPPLARRVVPLLIPFLERSA